MTEGATVSSLPRRLTAEALGTAFLLATVVGSGIMGEQLAGGSVAIALLANTIATGAVLVALILTFGSLSGAHFNPVVTIADASQGGLSWHEVPSYVLAQLLGAFAGVAVAHFMFERPALFFASQHERSGISQLVSEFVATFGLLSVIWGCARRRPGLVPFAVGAYITAAYWFTSSTSFANPAVTLARAASDTFAGIRAARAVSAGTDPGTRVHPEVLDAMKEVGVDLSDQTPQRLTDELTSGAKILITMGCGEQCPVVPGLKRDDWPLEDPKDKPMARVREIRDEVKARVVRLLEESGWARSNPQSR